MIQSNFTPSLVAKAKMAQLGQMKADLTGEEKEERTRDPFQETMLQVAAVEPVILDIMANLTMIV